MPSLVWRNGVAYVYFWKNGKRHRLSLRTKDKRIANQTFSEFSARHRLDMLGLPSEENNPFLNELFSEYLPFCKAHRSPRTYRDVKLHIEAKLAPFFGRTRAMDLTTRKIEEFIGRLKGWTVIDKKGKEVPAPYHPRTINLHLETLRKILRRAVEHGDIAKMPCPIKLIPAPRPLPKYATPEQIHTWLGFLDKAHRARAELSLNTGISDRDLGRVEWAGYNEIASTLSYKRRKTGQSIVVPLNKKARSIMAHLSRKRSGPYLFGGVQTIRKAYMTASTLSVMAGGIKITPHMLRHTFATGLLSKGAPLSHVQAILGHREPESTTVYAKVMPEYLRASVEALNSPVRKNRTQIGHTKKKAGKKSRPK